MPTPATNPVDEALRSYAAQLKHELQQADVAATGLPTSTNDWKWEDAFAAEAMLLRKLDPNALKRRAWIIYERYADVAGTEKAARRAAANPPSMDGGDVELLRADLLQVHAETARYYTIGVQVERERHRLTQLVTALAVVAFASLATLLTWPMLTTPGRLALVLVDFVVALLSVWWVRRGEPGRDNQSRKVDPGTPPDKRPWRPLKLRSRNTEQPPPDKPVPPPVAGILAFLCILTIAQATTAQTPSAQTGTAGTAVKTTSCAGCPDPDKPDPHAVPLLPLAVIAGVFGATLSILQRTQSAVTTDPLAALFRFQAARKEAVLSIISGAIASAVLFAIFAGGMVEGSLFPKLVNCAATSADCKTSMRAYDFIVYTGPQNYTDYGKLLVWSFIAGFAERLVPDMLDRFTATSKK
jgi:hypothetical protein